MAPDAAGHQHSHRTDDLHRPQALPDPELPGRPPDGGEERDAPQERVRPDGQPHARVGHVHGVALDEPETVTQGDGRGEQDRQEGQSVEAVPLLVHVAERPVGHLAARGHAFPPVSGDDPRGDTVDQRHPQERVGGQQPGGQNSEDDRRRPHPTRAFGRDDLRHFPTANGFRW